MLVVRLVDLAILFCIINSIIIVKCQSRPGFGMGMGGQHPGGGSMSMGGQGFAGGMSHGAGGSMMSGNRGLPPGYANIRGEIMDMSNKVIQRVTAAGTNYYSYENQNGKSVFQRREVDSGRRFVLFPDLNYPPGDGHYIVLRKMPGVNIPGMVPQPLYEAFHLSLGDSIHGYVTEFNNQEYAKTANQRPAQGGLFSGYGAATSGYGSMGMGGSAMSRGRRKRKSETVEMSPLQLNQNQDVASGDPSKDKTIRSTSKELTDIDSLNVANE